MLALVLSSLLTFPVQCPNGQCPVPAPSQQAIYYPVEFIPAPPFVKAEGPCVQQPQKLGWYPGRFVRERIFRR